MSLLRQLSNLWGVPVTGGIDVQFASSPKNDLSKGSENAVISHEGPTKTSYPQK